MDRQTASGITDLLLSGRGRMDSGASPVLLMLGDFKFSLNTAVFQEAQRSTNYRWRAQERIGHMDAMQYTGPGDDRLTLPGVLLPEFKGDSYYLDLLRQMAQAGVPYRLLSSTGAVLGNWVIEDIDTTESVYRPWGTAARYDFTIRLRRHSA